MKSRYMRNDERDITIKELEQQLEQLEIRSRNIKTQITKLKQEKLTNRRTGLSGFQLGDRVYGKTKGALNIRTGIVIGIKGDKITFRGDCGTKTWRVPKNLEVTERTRTEDEF